ncbi:hypothetical protein ARAM_000223 [Aspergillus rambellii]|uniref:AMP-binding enzyme n=1 Tax=Aspergillus rambellii TaxID=308745 RepID=A0A0F8WRU2_9EURO|nr:hypothetical protein ARAM_000223 [Aspergillus rambellii]
MAIELTKNGSEESAWVFHGPKEPPLLDWDTAQLIQFGALNYPTHTAIISSWQGKRSTYQELQQDVQSLVRVLLAFGVQHGDRLMVLAGNSIEFVHLYLATTYIGAIFTIINPMFTIKEVSAAVELIEPRMVFVSRRIGFRKNDKMIQMVSAATGTPEKLPQVIYFGAQTSEYGTALSYDQFLERGKTLGEDHVHEDTHVAPEDVCCFQFTSGTTGPRKASMLSHRNFINNGRLVGDLLGLTEKDILCCPPPLFHCFGLVCGLLASLSHGSTLVLPSEVFDPAKVIESLVKERCTVVNAVPTMFQSILDQEALDKLFSQLCLRTGVIAGASLSRDLLQKINDRLGLSGLIYPFGMTELSAVSLSTTRETSLLSNWTTVGKPLPHTSVKVIDEYGHVLPPGSPGELCVSGYLVHQGYYKAPEKSAEVVRVDENGTTWLYTGDIVSLSPDGTCTVLGRVKDMIKKGGENIVPKDIEEIIATHPAVSNVAVVGVPDPKWGENIATFVQEESGSQGTLAEKELKLWLRKHDLAPHKMPDYFFIASEETGLPFGLPVNASGKVLKTELRLLAQKTVKGKGDRK